mmetsp:Transcript_34991/g.68894  ORF Transcript_34991/g.68894 Transcript_34991/m.68894 type:complete len:114 (+) Transcript_34991:284-625(+)
MCHYFESSSPPARTEGECSLKYRSTSEPAPDIFSTQHLPLFLPEKQKAGAFPVHCPFFTDYSIRSVSQHFFSPRADPMAPALSTCSASPRSPHTAKTLSWQILWGVEGPQQEK